MDFYRRPCVWLIFETYLNKNTRVWLCVGFLLRDIQSDGCVKSQSVYSPCGKIVHCAKMPQFVFPFCCGWTSGLFPVWAVMTRARMGSKQSKLWRGVHF